jgi:hypothetical protein
VVCMSPLVRGNERSVTSAALIGVSVAGATLIAAQTLWVKRRVEQTSALRDEVGSAEVPPRKVYRTIALIVLGMSLGTAIIAIGDANDAPFILGTGVIGATLVATIWLSVRDGEAALRDAQAKRASSG